MRDRLIDLLTNSGATADTETFEEIADYLIKNGVIVPPCKMGDMVYVVSQGSGFNFRWNVYEGKVVDIHLDSYNDLSIRVENGESFFGYYSPCFVYNTKEEAENALKERLSE